MNVNKNTIRFKYINLINFLKLTSVIDSTPLSSLFSIGFLFFIFFFGGGSLIFVMYLGFFYFFVSVKKEKPLSFCKWLKTLDLNQGKQNKSCWALKCTRERFLSKMIFETGPITKNGYVLTIFMTAFWQKECCTYMYIHCNVTFAFVLSDNV